MKTNKQDILQNTSFEQLIKTTLLTNSEDKFNKKAIEMNANYIFSQPSQVKLTKQKLDSLIQQHQLGISKISGLIRFLLHWVAPTIILLSMGYYVNNKFNKEPQQKWIPPVTNEPIRDTTIIEELPTKTIEGLPVNVESKELKFKKLNKKTSKKKESDITYRALPAPMPKVRMYNPDLYEAPAPKFNMKASPKDYTLKAKGYFQTKSSKIFKLKKKAYYTSYYSGLPFEKGFENFVFVNNAEIINSQLGVSTFAKLDSNKNIVYRHSFLDANIIYLPDELKYFLDKYEVNNTMKLVIDKISKQQLDLLLKPFYFSKYEVSVKEYKEFANWVLESNGIEKRPYSIDTLANVRASHIDGDNYDKANENRSKLRARYVKWNVNKEKAYNYTFFKPSKATLEALKTNNISIAPLDSIYQKYINQFDRVYEINPFYGPNIRDNYEERVAMPVVGISYYQALAFLDWKTHFHQEQLDNEGVAYEIEYALPNSLERSLATGKSEKDYREWLCDLYLTEYKISNLDKLINQNSFRRRYKTSSLEVVLPRGKFYKFEVDKHVLANGITWLDGNASEWMSDSYRTNWNPAFEAHKAMVEDSEEDEISLQIEEFYNQSNHPQGQLVMGGNYLDYRENPETDKGFNKAGIYLKKYINPHQQYSTIGFRYIIKVRDADEAKKERLLGFIGSFDYDKYNDFPEAYMDDFKFFDNGKYILDKEVTNGMWRSFLKDLIENGREEEALICIPQSDLWRKYNEDYIYYFRDLKYDALPVVNISHKAAQLFNKWMTDKFNSYALRKYGKVEFVLPTEREWEKAASGRLNNIKYSWGGPYARNYKGCKNANFKMLPYVKNFYSNEELINKLDSSFGSEKFEIIDDSLRIPHYEAFDKGEISYPTFREVDDDYWKRKSKVLILTIKDLKKLKKKRKSECNYSKGNGLFLFEKGVYFSNDIGIYDIHGNVAEMVEDSNLVKGGSWNSYSELSIIAKSEPWYSKASPMVGFRPVMKILYKGFDHDTKVKAQAIPPGTVLLNPNFGVDKTEITNVDYREYMYYTMQMYGKESRKYQSTVPDTAVWDFSELFTDSLSEKANIVGDTATDSSINSNYPLQSMYLRHPAYKNYPLVGLSHTQAKSFCVWRSERVNELNAIFHAKNPDDKRIPKHVTYRLPSPEEWDNILLTDSLYNGKTYEKPNLEFQTKAIEHHSSHPSDYGSPNKIGIYGLKGNVSEMTSEEGLAKGEHWVQKYLKQPGKDVKYNKAESWIGFRCVVDVEY